MSAHFGIERRDPASGVLMLGKTLAAARREGRSGFVEVRNGGLVRGIRIDRGAITGVLGARETVLGHGIDPPRLSEHIQRIFTLERPHIVWSEDVAGPREQVTVDPASAVLSGVIGRRDLFQPRKLVDRIPVDTLRVDPELLSELRYLPLQSREIAFLERLTVPAPIPIILWKRGLDPGHAGALLVALNLIGLFDGEWRPGDLPRTGDAARLHRRIASAVDDYTVLGVDENASDEEVDKAFRALSLKLHPDRLAGVSETEAARARAAFVGVSQAYSRLRRSRRSRPVRGTGSPIAKITLQKRETTTVQTVLDESRRAAEQGERRRARAFALKGLAMGPPEGIRAELLRILRKAA